MYQQQQLQQANSTSSTANVPTPTNLAPFLHISPNVLLNNASLDHSDRSNSTNSNMLFAKKPQTATTPSSSAALSPLCGTLKVQTMTLIDQKWTKN
jgi:hypothetical protein